MRSTACRRVAECMRRAATAPRPLAPDRAPTHRALSIRAIATTTDAAEPSNTPGPTSPGPNPAPRGRLPAFDYTALVASVCEVRALATPTKVEIAAQADAYTLVLGLRGIDGNVALHVSWHPDAARVCLGPPAPRIHKTEQLSFGEQCNALLRNLVLTRASMPEPWERIASFSFADRTRRRRQIYAALRSHGTQQQRGAGGRVQRQDGRVRLPGGCRADVRATHVAGVRIPPAPARAGDPARVHPDRIGVARCRHQSDTTGRRTRRRNATRGARVVRGELSERPGLRRGWCGRFAA